jgi:hypothetical protein
MALAPEIPRPNTGFPSSPGDSLTITESLQLKTPRLIETFSIDQMALFPFSRTAALRVTCPYCESPPGVACMGTRGPRVSVHIERIYTGTIPILKERPP